MFWKKNGKRRVKIGDLTAFIDEGSEIEGTCTFSGTVVLNGTVRGEIASTDTVIVGETAVAHAEIRGGTIIISGQVVGKLVATQRLELRGAARVFGDIEAPVVVLEEGVLFEGHCRMTPSAGVVAGAPTVAPPQRDLSIVR